LPPVGRRRKSKEVHKTKKKNDGRAEEVTPGTLFSSHVPRKKGKRGKARRGRGKGRGKFAALP